MTIPSDYATLKNSKNKKRNDEESTYSYALQRISHGSRETKKLLPLRGIKTTEYGRWLPSSAPSRVYDICVTMCILP